MSNLTQLTGIFGGAFDPIHLGHIHVLEQLAQHFHYKEIRVIPYYKPVHKANLVATPEDRLAMVKLATQPLPGILVDERELERKGASYTIDTLRSLYEDHPDRDYHLIIGSDAIADFTKWKEWEEILTYTHIIVANRQNNPIQLPNNLKPYETSDKYALEKQKNGLIYSCAIPFMPISATAIRQQLLQGKQMNSQTLPACILDYIYQHNLYQK